MAGTSAFTAALNAGDDGDAADTVSAKTAAAQGLLGRKKPYCLRAHVFQCRGLPSSEASGLLDPYIKVGPRLVLVVKHNTNRGSGSYFNRTPQFWH